MAIHPRNAHIFGMTAVGCNGSWFGFSGVLMAGHDPRSVSVASVTELMLVMISLSAIDAIDEASLIWCFDSHSEKASIRNWMMAPDELRFSRVEKPPTSDVFQDVAFL